MDVRSGDIGSDLATASSCRGCGMATVGAEKEKTGDASEEGLKGEEGDPMEEELLRSESGDAQSSVFDVLRFTLALLF